MEPPNNNYPPTPYRFSSEEMRALQECNSESFFQRSLPLSTLMGFGTFAAVRNGVLSPNNRYGAVPKVVAAVLAGYVLGKVSYQGKCVEKIMAIPNSKLGAMLRERKRSGKFNETLSLNQPDLGKILEEMPQSETYSDFPKQSSHLDIDSDRPSTFSDDLFSSPRTDLPMDSDSPLSSNGPSTSYDDLRKRNREAYDSNRNTYRRPAARTEDYQPPEVSRPQPEPMPERPKPTNVYGDVWEK